MIPPLPTESTNDLWPIYTGLHSGQFHGVDPIAKRLASADTDPRYRIARTSTLLAEGLDPLLLRRLLRKDWHRMHHGVIALGEAASQDLACRAQAALVSIGHDASISHETGAQLLAFPGANGLGGIWKPDAHIHASVPKHVSTPARQGVTIHRRAPLPTWRVAGVRIAAPVHIAQDLLVSLPLEVAVAAIEGALHERILRADQLQEIRSGLTDRQGSAAGRRAFARIVANAESPLETISRLRLEDLGYAPHAIQVSVHDSQGRFVGRADMEFRRGSKKVYGEADGLATHNGRQMRRDDSIREEGFRRTGAGVVRWDWHDMLEGMGEVAQRIDRAFEDL